MRPRLLPVLACVLASLAFSLTGAGSAWAGPYVSLGDSFSAGEGAGAYDRTSGSCHRSRRAWPRVMGVVKAHHLACSGAKVAHVISEPQKRLGPDRRKQLDRLQAISESVEIDTVLLTIGGNDLGFSRKMAVCVFALRSCLSDHDAIDRELEAVKPRLTDAYARIYASAQARRLVVVGYPDIIPNPGESTVRCGWLKDAKRRNIEYLQGKLDETLADAAAAAGAIHISVRDALRDDQRVGHELCTKDSWMYPVTSRRLLGPPRTLTSRIQQQGHPTEDGQDALAAAVRAGLRDWDTAPGEYCSSEGPSPVTGITTLYAHMISCEAAARVRVEYYEGRSAYRDRLSGNWRCRIIGGTPNTDDVPEVRCENNGRFVRWTHT